jgi:hypothetical protein
MSLETPDTRLAKSSELLGEVEGLVDRGEGVVVCALRSRASRTSEKVAEKRSVPRFLIGHKLNEKAIRWSEASCGEVLLAESSKNVVEEIKLNPLLVESKKNGLIVEVRLNAVYWLSSIGTQTTRWLVWHWLRLVEETIGHIASLFGIGR